MKIVFVVVGILHCRSSYGWIPVGQYVWYTGTG